MSNNKVTYITELTSPEALDFLMKSEQYHTFELPEYFDFDTVLAYVKDSVGEKEYTQCSRKDTIQDMDHINVNILLNKDGKYAVRPLTLCNPFLYYFLVREICGPSNWERVKNNFKKCRVAHITPCALPVIPEKVEKFHKSTTILNWWNSMEQRSIELSLEYRYMFVSDITNCYGTVNPQTIDWALSRKNTSIQTDENHDTATHIMKYLRDLQNGRNIGIPQGSTLFDLIAEIILCYADLLLHEALQKKGITDGYEILRYRDDYKIFCNNRDVLEEISYTLQHILETLNFRMNSSKTRISDSIISDSIKPDKLFYIFNTPIFNKKGCDFDGLQKHLLYIMMFGRKFPNSGQLRTMLSDLDNRIKEKLEPQTRTIFSFTDENSKPKPEEEVVPGKIVENIRAMCAIATQIAIENITLPHYALRVISRMLHSMENETEKKDIINKVSNRLTRLPNSTYCKIWLQNMTYSQDKADRKETPYDVNLCRVVMGEHVELWDNSWLQDEITKDFPLDSIVNKDTLAKVTPVITFRGERIYTETYDEYPDIFEKLGL